MEFEIGSDEWLKTNNAFISVLPGEFGDFSLGIEISDGPETQMYSLIIEHGTPRLESGIPETCPIRLKITKTVAGRLHRGTTSVAEAISNGDIKISGHAETLINSGEILSVLSRALHGSS